MCRWMAAAAGVLVMVCAREAAAQSATFGVGVGGLGTAFLRTAELDARLVAAGRSPVGGPAGGLRMPVDGSIGPVRAVISIEGAFQGRDATREVSAFTGVFQLGARFAREGWVLLPSVGLAFSTLTFRFPEREGEGPRQGARFDRILSGAAGDGELRGTSIGARFEVGVDREWRIRGTRGLADPSVYVGARAGVTQPIGGGVWRWNQEEARGPAVPVVSPYLGLVLGVRALGGE